MEILEELQQSADYLKERGVDQVDAAIVLGTGLGGLVDAIEAIQTELQSNSAFACGHRRTAFWKVDLRRP